MAASAPSSHPFRGRPLTGGDRARRDGGRIRYAVLARSIEASVPGEAPTAFRLWRAGVNKTDKGDLKFTPRSARLCLAAWEKRGNPLVGYYEHEDQLPLSQRRGAPMQGAASAPRSVLAIRETPDGPEAWAEEVAWTAEARRQIVSGERRQISPVAAYDEETREIVEIRNFSLCAEGATHHGTILASRGVIATGKEQDMDELLQQLQDAIAAKDWESCENLINQLEAMDGGAAVAAMARGYAAMAKGEGTDVADPGAGANDEPPKQVAVKRLAASRQPDALTEAKRAQVYGVIALNRDYFDAADERRYIDAADPKAAEAHVASLKRKGVKVGSFSRGPEAKPPKGEAAADPTFGLSAHEIEAATRSNVPLEDMAKAKARNSGKGA